MHMLTARFDSGVALCSDHTANDVSHGHLNSMRGNILVSERYWTGAHVFTRLERSCS
jgi:hypothetical protein